MAETSIEWADRVWNPVRGCTRVSEGCRHCYAERLAARNLPEMRSPTTGKPFAHSTPHGPRWTGKVELIESKLDEPLSWRKPWRVFVNSMSDLFHESLPPKDLARVFCRMAGARKQTFMVLTKRAGRMLEFVSGCRACEHGWITHNGENPSSYGGTGVIVGDPDRWPPPNVWLGVSVEDQATADERIPLLLQTPAAVRFVSYEPALGPINFGRYYFGGAAGPYPFPSVDEEFRTKWIDLLDLVIYGGESGPGARPNDLAWARSAQDQCRAARDLTGKRPAFFMKQAGARPFDSAYDPSVELAPSIHMKDRKGGDLAELPESLRVREFPEARGV